MTPVDSNFVVSFVINVVLMLVFLILFLVFRGRVPKIYQPRCNGSKNAPPPPPNTLFGWFFSTLRYSDEDLFRTHGLDVVMFTNVVRMMFYMAVFVSLYGFIVLFAVNSTGENTKLPTNSTYHVSGLETLTVSGIDTDSRRLGAHVVGVVLNTIVIFFFSYRMYRTFMHYRLRFKSSKDRIENFSVMVRGVPKAVDDESLRTFFDQLFPGKVVDITRSYSTRKLNNKLEQRDTAKRDLEKAWAVDQINAERPIKKKYILFGKQVDAIQFFTAEFERFTKRALELQKGPIDRASVVFVVFNDLAAASQCGQLLLDTQDRFMPEPAPDPRDLIWSNFYIDQNQFIVRKVVINICFFFLTCFWTIPVVAISAISNLDNLAKLGPFKFLVDFINLSPVVTGFVQGFLPTLAFIIFWAILIKLMTFLVTISGVYTKSKVSRVVTTKYYVFQVYNVLIVFTLAGSIIATLKDIIDDWTQIATLLGNSIPTQSGFFVNYVMLLSLSGHTKDLWNPGPLIVRFVKHKLLSKTQREYIEAEAPGPYKYAEKYTTHLLVFTILLVYSTLAPFIMIFGVLYFGMAFVSSKYNLIYVAVPEYEGGGKHWHDIFYRINAALILYHIILACVFSLKKFPAGTIISVICLVATIVFTWYTRKQFVRSSDHLAQRYATRRDKELIHEPSKAQMDRIPSEDPHIRVDDELEYSKEGKPFLPVYEANRMDVTNLTAHMYYVQPCMVPLADEPEFVLAPGKKSKRSPDDWKPMVDGKEKAVEMAKMEDGIETPEDPQRGSTTIGEGHK